VFKPLKPAKTPKLVKSDTISRAVHLMGHGLSCRTIAHKLRISPRTVASIRRDHAPYVIMPRGGRPKKIDARLARRMVRLVTNTKIDTVRKLSKHLAATENIDVSTRTIARTLKESGLKAVVKRKRPMLSDHHQRARLEFARKYQHWTVADWRKVVFTDESKINRLGSDGRVWVWKRRNEPLNGRLIHPTMKYGGGHVMMWGCITAAGAGSYCRIFGTMDASLYVEILGGEFLQTLEDLGLTVADVIFQHDNDPKHTSKLATNWLADNEVEVLDWPAQSPDLNPIEHVWGYLKQQLALYPEPPAGIEELWDRIQEQWERIPVSFITALYESMPERIEAVLAAKGGYTRF
jgi:transposase